MKIDEYTVLEDLHWYFVSYSNGKKIGSIEIGLKKDIFVPSEIKLYIEKQNSTNYCCIINWKKMKTEQLSTETKTNFIENVMGRRSNVIIM